jgi:hypothetical protein
LADMKKITVALEDDVYLMLIDYVAAKSKKTGGRLSVSESASELIALGLPGSAMEAELEAR